MCCVKRVHITIRDEMDNTLQYKKFMLGVRVNYDYEFTL